MNAGKSTSLLQSNHNYKVRNLQTYLFTPKVDADFHEGNIHSRLGVQHKANIFDDKFNFFEYFKDKENEKIACILVDEAQFLSENQVKQLCKVCDKYNIPVMCYGIRTDFRGELFSGSMSLLAYADTLVELKTICEYENCARKATMVARFVNGEYRQLLQRSPMGSKFKVFAVYAEAFWREEGYCGMGRGNLQILEEIADSGPVECNPGIMVSFVAGNKAAALNRLSDKEQRRLILEDFVRYLGPKAAEPLDLVVQRWIDEQWTTGGYTAFRTPGAWTGFGTTWQQPHGRIFWAGTEESTRWPGYFEGAIEAGIQAVDRAAAALDGGVKG